MRSGVAHNGDRVVVATICTVFAAIVTWLAAALPPRTFFAGDPGVKLIVARNAIEHPGRPLDVDVPAIAGRALPFVDPFFRLHGGHAHATMPALFPLLSAPLIAAFGIRGAFVLPAAGFLLAVAATAWIARILDPHRCVAMAALATAVCTPLLFYALEFWEHAVAVGAAALGAALFVAPPRSGPRLVVSGALLALSALLRPEAAWFGVAMIVGSQMLPAPVRATHIILAAGGAAALAVPAAAYSAMHAGQVFSGHVTGNLSALPDEWLATRAAIGRAWFLAASRLPLSGCVLIAGLGAGTVLMPRRARVLHLIAMLAGAAVVAASVAGAFPRASLWCAAPATALLPDVNRPRPRRAASPR